MITVEYRATDRDHPQLVFRIAKAEGLRILTRIFLELFDGRSSIRLYKIGEIGFIPPLADVALSSVQGQERHTVTCETDSAGAIACEWLLERDRWEDCALLVEGFFDPKGDASPGHQYMTRDRERLTVIVSYMEG